MSAAIFGKEPVSCSDRLSQRARLEVCKPFTIKRLAETTPPVSNIHYDLDLSQQCPTSRGADPDIIQMLLTPKTKLQASGSCRSEPTWLCVSPKDAHKKWQQELSRHLLLTLAVCTLHLMSTSETMLHFLSSIEISLMMTAFSSLNCSSFVSLWKSLR